MFMSTKRQDQTISFTSLLILAADFGVIVEETERKAVGARPGIFLTNTGWKLEIGRDFKPIFLREETGYRTLFLAVHFLLVM